MDDSFIEKARTLSFRPKGIPYEKPMSREVLGPPRILRKCYCYMHEGVFESDHETGICPPCQLLVAASEKAMEDVPDGNLPPGMARVTKMTGPGAAR